MTIRRIAFLAPPLLLLLACGGSGDGSASLSSTPTITQSPSSKTVFLGQQATFSVTASGLGALSYQWRRNGVAIPGATDPSYTIPATASTDDSANFDVTVCDHGLPALSATATLIVLPPLDLRFKGVGGPPSLASSGTVSSVLPRMSMGMDNAVGTPLVVGSAIAGNVPDSSSWSYATYSLSGGMSGMSVAYRAGSFGNYASDVAALSAADPNRVITSLDMEESSANYVVSYHASTQAGIFTPIAYGGSVLPADLQTAASHEGTYGRVLTAVSFTGGQVTYVAYGWTQAPAAVVYETRVAFAPASGVGAAASDLSAQGYVITAFGAGHNAAEGYVLVGTRPQGSTTPRTLTVTTLSTRTVGMPQREDGAVNVGQFYDAASGTTTVLYQR